MYMDALEIVRIYSEIGNDDDVEVFFEKFSEKKSYFKSACGLTVASKNTKVPICSQYDQRKVNVCSKM